MSDIQDLIYKTTMDCLERGKLQERARIKVAILERVLDLKNCNDDDDCHLFGEFIESYIPEWLGEEE